MSKNKIFTVFTRNFVDIKFYPRLLYVRVPVHARGYCIAPSLEIVLPEGILTVGKKCCVHIRKIILFFVCSIMTSQWSKAVFLCFQSYLLGYSTKILEIQHEVLFWYFPQNKTSMTSNSESASMNICEATSSALSCAVRR